MTYFDVGQDSLSFFKNFLKEYFSDESDDRKAIDNAKQFLVEGEKKSSDYREQLKESFDYILNTTFEEDTLMEIMEEFSSRDSYEDRDAKRFFTMIYENLFLGKDEIYDYYEPTEEDLEAERREQEELRRKLESFFEESLKWAEGKSDETLLDYVNNHDVEVRCRAIIALRYRDNDKIINLLITRFKVETEIRVKIYLLESLTKKGGRLATELFFEIVRDENVQGTLRRLALNALAELSEVKAITPILEQYKEGKKHEVETAGEINKFGAAGFDALMKVLLAGSVKQKLVELTITLGEKNDEIINVLLNNLKPGNHEINLKVLKLLTSAVCDDTREQISKGVIPYLKDSNEKVRAAVAEYLHYFKSVETVDALNEALNDSDENVRHCARVSLGLLKA